MVLVLIIFGIECDKLFIERKIFLKDDEAFYLAKVFHPTETGKYEKILLKSKTSDTTMVNEKYPIVAVLKIENLADIENPKSTAKNFRFKEWAFIKPITPKPAGL